MRNKFLAWLSKHQEEGHIKNPLLEGRGKKESKYLIPFKKKRKKKKVKDMYYTERETKQTKGYGKKNFAS